MALSDVKAYYDKMLAQYIEMKDDLQDFSKAVADGYVTMDQLEAMKEDVDRIAENYHRLSYIMFLLEVPNRSSKKKKHAKANKKLLDAFNKKGADAASVYDENRSVLNHIREEFKNLTSKE